MSKSIFPYIKVALAMILLGSIVPANKVITESFPVFLVSEIRLMIAMTILLCLLFFKEGGFPRFSKRDIIVLFLQSFIGIFLYSILLLYGLKYSSGIESGILTSTTPMFIGLVSFFIFKEKLSRNKMIGIIIAAIGTLCTSLFGIFEDTMAVGIVSFLGTILIISSVIADSIFMTFGKLVSKHISALCITTVIVCFSTLFFFPFSLYEIQSFHFHEVKLETWLLVLYTAIIVTVFATLLLNQGISQIPASTGAIFSAFMPLSAIFFSAFLLGEQLYWYHFLGLTLVLISIGLISFDIDKNIKKTEKIKAS